VQCSEFGSRSSVANGVVPARSKYYCISTRLSISPPVPVPSPIAPDRHPLAAAPHSRLTPSSTPRSPNAGLLRVPVPPPQVRLAPPRPASSRLSGFSVRGGVDLPRHCSFCQSDAAELLRRRGKRARKEAAARMSRRSVNPSRRMADGGLPSVGGLLHPKSRSPPVLTIALVVLVPPPPPLRPSHSIAADVVVVTCTSRLAF
jgi:hypothetical protein